MNTSSKSSNLIYLKVAYQRRRSQLVFIVIMIMKLVIGCVAHQTTAYFRKKKIDWRGRKKADSSSWALVVNICPSKFKHGLWGSPNREKKLFVLQINCVWLIWLMPMNRFPLLVVLQNLHSVHIWSLHLTHPHWIRFHNTVTQQNII
jgi:hypothetical protein